MREREREREKIFAWEERKRNERVKYCRLREDTTRVCARAKKEEAAQERKRRESNQERAMCGEENKKEKTKCCRI